MINCPFCNNQLRIQMYQSECKDCQVTFLSRQIGSKLDSPWHTYYFTFKFRDEVYHSLNLNFDEGKTFIWLNNKEKPLHQHRIDIPSLLQDVNPSNALSIARRLHNLIAFT